MLSRDIARDPLPAPDEAQQEQVGQQLIKLCKLSPKEVAHVRAWQHHRGCTFAEAAVSMGLARREELMTILSRQYSYPILNGDVDAAARFSRELVVGHEPFGNAAESVRSIRSAIVSSAVSNGTRSFLVAGARAGAGSSFLCGNLALAFAQMSVPTLLVDADLRSSRIAEMFGLNPSRAGLSDALRTRKIDNLPIEYDVIPGLSILTSGTMPPNPQELLSSAEFLALTNNLSKEFGVVIYDTASAMDYADTYVVGSRVGAAILVARQHRTKFAEISTVSRKLQAIQCKIIGTILNS